MKILDIVFKDLVRSFRSTFALGMMFIAPLLITGLIYFAFGGLSAGTGRFNLPTLTVAIVNQDTPTQNYLNLGKSIIEFMQDKAMPSWMQVVEMPDAATARAALDAQQVGVIVLVPRNLSDAALSPDERASITLIQDPTLTIGPAFVQDVMGLFLDGVNSGKIALKVVSTQVAATGHALSAADQQTIFQDYSAWYTALQQDLHHGADPILASQALTFSGDAPRKADPVAALMAKVMAGMLIFFVFYTGVNTAQSILREDEEGTLARLFTTPTPRAVILAGKFTSIFITISIQAIVLMAASALAFHINWGEPSVLVLVTLGLIVTAAGFGVLIVSFIKTTRQGGTIIGGMLTVTSMLGGLFTSGVAMPAAFDTLTLLTPQGWAMRGWKLALDGGGAGDVLVPVIVMLAMGAVFFAIGALNFRKRFA